MDSVREILLADLIDYAGLFPPARLEMLSAVRNYLEYRDGPDAWMLGRFIVPAARRDELDAACAALGVERASLPLSVIPGGGRVREDADALGAEAVEVRLPDHLVEPADPAGVMAWIRAHGFQATPMYLEAGWPDGDALAGVIDGIAAARVLGCNASLKIRCGGLEPAAFPSSEQIATAVVLCLDGGVPLKATAGLHHPLPRHDDSLGVRTHGFLNLFGGAALALANDLDVAEIRAILEDDRRDAFTLEERRLTWRDLEASSVDVMNAREILAVSFGSCSFDEPREDLRGLGILPPTT